ncbi:MAG TPA: hypothetical protein PKL15_03695 [Saprospiraceae bacterium]|nr:hypothetical protein [Saprospiraceae bacterium]
MKNLFSLLALLFWLSTAHAQWQYGGGPSQTVWFKRGLERVGNELWMGTFDNIGLYRSIDGFSWMQATFFPVNTDIYDIYAESPTSVLLLTCDRGHQGNMTVYRLEKKGDNWGITARFPLPVNCCSNIAKVVRSGDRVVAHNQSWDALIGVNPDSSIAFNVSCSQFAFNDGVLIRSYVFGNLYKVAFSTDNGTTWGYPYQTDQQISAVFVDEDYFWMTRWDQKLIRKSRATGQVVEFSNLTAQQLNFHDIYLRFGKMGDTLTLASNFKWWYSTDDGASWQILSEYEMPGIQYDVIEELPEWPTVFAQGNNMIRSDDDGETWQKINAGIGAYSILMLDRNGIESYLFAATDAPGKPLYRSANGGQSWTALNTPFTGHQFNDMQWMGQASFFVLESNDLYFTADNGSTWLQLSDQNDFAAQKLDGYYWNVYAQGLYEIRRYYYEDGALTGTISPSPAAPGNAIADFSPGPGEWYLWMQSGDFYYSTDEGATWTWRSHTPFTQTAKNITRSGNNLIAWANNIVLYSTDKGQSWLPAQFPGYYGDQLNDAIGSATNGAFAAMQWKGVFNSPDDGATWYPLADGLYNPNIYTLLISNNKLYAGSHRGGYWHRPVTASFVRGMVYRDLNQSGTFNTGEPPVANAIVKASPSGQVASTDAWGRFFLPYQPGQNDTLQITSLPAAAGNLAPSWLVVSQPTNSANFGVKDWPAVDLNVHLGAQHAFRAGENALLYLQYANAGDQQADDLTLECRLPAGMSFSWSSPWPDQIAGDTLRWYPGNLAAAAHQSINIQVALDAGLAAGSSLVVTAVVESPSPDASSNDNRHELQANVWDSGAPEPAKEVDRTILTATDIAEGKPLEFTLRFQNQGAGPATVLVIEDQLDAALDPATIQLVASSHPCLWKISDNNLLTISFPNINLPASWLDEAGSHGFVRIAVKARTGIQMGSVIENKASFTFDLDLPTWSNTTQTQVQLYDPNDSQLDPDLPMGLRPNPAEYHLIADWNIPADAEGRVWMVDAGGVIRLEETIAPGQYDIELNVTYIPAGIYVVFVDAGSHHYVRTAVVEHPNDPRRNFSRQ